MEYKPSASGLYVPETYFPSRHARTLDTGYGHAVEISHGKWRLIDEGGELRLPPIRGGASSVAYRFKPATVFAATTGAKTFMMAIATVHGLSLTEFAISFDGVTSSAVPALVEIVNSTQGAAGTPGDSTIVTQVRGRATSGAAPTFGARYNGEPTTLVSLSVWYIPQFMGSFTYQMPLGREIECDGSGGTTRGLGVRINVTANVNAVGHLECEAVG